MTRNANSRFSWQADREKKNRRDDDHDMNKIPQKLRYVNNGAPRRTRRGRGDRR
jgi:hypothetical protein